MNALRLIIVLWLALVVGGCAAIDTVTGYFDGGDDNLEPPKPLTEYPQEISVSRVWRESVGEGTGGQALNLVAALDVGKVYAADKDGQLQARNAGNGNLLWEADTGLPFSAGPGVGGGLVVLGTRAAQVAAFSADTGRPLWTAKVNSEVLSVPAVADGKVLVRCTDGSVWALAAATGAKLWNYETSVPALSVRGTGTLLVYEDMVIGGYDNGKVLALRLKDGKYVWETSVALPKGRSEVERLVDIDADLALVGGVVFAASHNSGISAIAQTDGDVLWRNEGISSHTGLGHDWRHLYLADTVSDVWQLDMRGGSSLWRQQDLRRRQLSAPAVYDGYVVVGDFEGYVHWLSASDGRLLARRQVADAPITAQPQVADGLLYVYASDGTLAALRAGGL